MDHGVALKPILRLWANPISGFISADTVHTHIYAYAQDNYVTHIIHDQSQDPPSPLMNRCNSAQWPAVSTLPTILLPPL